MIAGEFVDEDQRFALTRFLDVQPDAIVGHDPSGHLTAWIWVVWATRRFSESYRLV